MYDFDFELTEKDFIGFGRDIMTIPRIRNMNLLICVLIFLFTFLLACMTLNNKVEIIVIAIILLALIPCTMILQGINTGKINYKANNKFGYSRKMHFDDSGITIDTGKSTTNINWNGIVEVYNKKNTILLFQTGLLAIIIPKRIFSTEQEITEFFEYVKQRQCKE